MRGHLLVTTGVVLALAITHAGCSSKDDPAPASDGGTSTSSSGTPGDGGVACIDTNDIDSCSTCCGKQHVEANDKLTSIVLKCMCQDTNCKEACKDSLCGSTDPNYAEGSPCDICVREKNPTCTPIASDECKADTVCQPIFDCLIDNDCTAKPSL